jgi:hypothetical protein
MLPEVLLDFGHYLVDGICPKYVLMPFDTPHGEVTLHPQSRQLLQLIPGGNELAPSFGAWTVYVIDVTIRLQALHVRILHADAARLLDLEIPSS